MSEAEGGLGGLPIPVAVLCAGIRQQCPAFAPVHFYPGDSLWVIFSGPPQWSSVLCFQLQVAEGPFERGVGLDQDSAGSGGGIPVELFQILKDDAVKVLCSICQKIWKTQQWPQD